jgi:DNA-binding transcriptional regulator YbjK
MAATTDELHARRTQHRARQRAENRAHQHAEQRGRRPLLADAAITILARDGGRGLTHRAIDREAGVPEGTTKNYHPTRQHILEAAAQRMAELHRAAVDRLRETTPPGATPHQLRMLYPALIRRAVHNDPTPTLAMLELYLEGVRRPAIRTALGTMATANAHAAAELHHTAGVPSTITDTATLDACLLGILVTQLALPADALAATGLDDTDTIGTHLFDTTTGYPNIPTLRTAAQA